MNIIKHYVIIRFYCVDMYNIGLEKLFNNNLLDAAKIFEKYTLKSLENQTNKNFEIILVIHNKINYDHIAISYLHNIKSNLKIHIVRYKDVHDFIRNNLNNKKYLITSRIDHDDLIYNQAVEEIQNKCNNIDCYYNGYDKVITMINDDYKNTYKFYPDYKGNGSISIFQSLIINMDKINKIITIYDLGNHAKQKDNFKNLFYNNNLIYKDDYFNLNHLEDSGIYIKHNFNISTLKNPLLEKKWHRNNIKINQPKDWFIKRFGIFIN